ncbi:MAG: ribosomal biogenesis protein, partial [Candidatus Methanomethylophilaceae archaeon]|nr:ribosomal biogenesis protein [Candidatus Methanomethylophilaceae archaeon]
MTILVTKWFGTFLIDEKSGKITDKRIMPHDAHRVAEKLAEMQRGNLLEEERELAATVEGKLAVGDR